MKACFFCGLVGMLALAGPPAHAQVNADAAARQRLHQRQLEDTLRLQSQQSLPPRSSLSPGDARRLDALQLRQRAEQQALASEQLRLERQRAQRPGDDGLALRQRLLEQQSELQLQRFRLEQQELLQSAKQRPLQQ